MSFSSGTFSINSSGQPVITGTVISSNAFNALTADLATGLSTCLLKDGTQTVTANIPMATYKFTGLGAGSAAGDSVRYEQLQNNTLNYLTSVAGTNTVTASTASAPVYAVGQIFTGIAAATNTGATTLNISSAGAGAVQWQGLALKGGELVIGMPFTVLVSAATPVFQIISPLYVIRQNSQSTAYTTVLSDMNNHVLHPTADNNPRTFTIDSNANVAYPVGTAITFVNQINTVTIAITSDTMTLAGVGSTGSRTLAANGMATALKIASTSWVISGTGIS